MDDNNEIETLRRENAILAKRFAKSEQYRARTEELKDKLQVLLKTISQEISESREEVAGQKQEVEILYQKLAEEKEAGDRVIASLLPPALADELRANGSIRPSHVADATVLFTDFVGFTKVAGSADPAQLLDHLDECFSGFDLIVDRHGLDKIKTIGDSYMCAGGLFGELQNHTVRTALAGLEMLKFARDLETQRSRRGLFSWQIRLGMHHGPVVMGAIGRKGLFFDLWGDTVNTAARMVQNAPDDKFNVSGETESVLRPYFELTARGELEVKSKGRLPMFVVDGLKTDYSEDADRLFPNHVLRRLLKTP